MYIIFKIHKKARRLLSCMIKSLFKVKEVFIVAFSSDLIVFYGTDLIGNEIGAALKTVAGIAAGMLDGLNMSSLKGALMARGTSEVGRLIKIRRNN